MARPKITLKLATSLDGKIATYTGQSRWITGKRARTQVHALRAEHNAVMIGSQTALNDDPMLNIRLPDNTSIKQPIRIVADSRARLSLNSRLVESANNYSESGKVLLLTSNMAEVRHIAALKSAGVIVVQLDLKGGRHIHPEDMLNAMAEHDIVSVLLEGGGKLAASFLHHNLVDFIEWFRAPMIIGGDGLDAIGTFGFDTLNQTLRFRRIELNAIGLDIWERYEKI